MLALVLAGCGIGRDPAPQVVVRDRLVLCPPQAIQNECVPTLPRPQGPELADHIDAWDQAPAVLHCYNGLVDLWEKAHGECRSRIKAIE